MRLFNKSNCLLNWQIQAFIDGELDNMELFESHIKQCASCKQKKDAKQKKVKTLLNSIEILDNPVMYKDELKQHPVRTISVKGASVWFGVAASIAITAILINHYQTQKQDNVLEECNWVTLNEDSFDPTLVSPNRLLQMRTMKLEEVDIKTNVTKTVYLVKTCKKQ